MKQSIIVVITMVLSILFSSCEDPSDSMVYGAWRLEKYNSIATSSYGLTPVVKNDNYILQFNKSGKFSFTTDCNTLSGDYSIDKTGLIFTNISFTEKACKDMIVEESLKSNLMYIKSCEIKDDRLLILKDKDGNILMELSFNNHVAF